MSGKKKGLLGKIIGAVIALVVILVIVLVVVVMNLGSIVKHGGETIVSKITKCETTIGSASISPFGKVEIKDVIIKNPSESSEGEKTSFNSDKFFGLGKISIDLDMMSLLSDEIHVNDITLEGTEVTYEKNLTAASNLDVIMNHLNALSDDEKKEEKEETKDETASGKTVVINHLLVKGTKVGVSSMGIGTDLEIPAIELNGIGEKGNGVTLVSAICTTLKEIFTGIVPAIKNAGISAGKAAVDSVKNVTDGVKNLGGNIKGMFKDDSKDENGSVKESVEEVKSSVKEVGNTVKEVGAGLKGLFKK